MTTSSTKNVKLGVCKVYLGGQDMGVTQGGVEVAVTTDTHVVNVDQFGKTTINELIMGRNVKVKAPLAETTVRNMVAIMPGTTLISDGAQATGTLTFTVPAAATTFTIGGQAYTFTATTVAKPTTAYMIQLASTAAQSVQNAMDTINRTLMATTGALALISNAGGVMASVSAALPLVINLTAGDPGTAGNAVTTVGASGVTAGGATMTGGVAETKVRVETTTSVGTDLLSTAKQLRLHPLGKGDTDYTDDFTVYQAATAGALTFAYKVDAERVFNVEFNAYPDSAGRLFSVGDPAA